MLTSVANTYLKPCIIVGMDDEPYEDEDEYWEPDLGPMVVWLTNRSHIITPTRKKLNAKIYRHNLGKLPKVRVPSKSLRRSL